MIIDLLFRAGRSGPRAGLAMLLAASLVSIPAYAQSPEPAQGQRLTVVIVEGEGAINNVRQRAAREPIVEVQDENHRPVAGAVVVFTILPSNGGAGASFLGTSQTAEFVTDSAGRAVARGFQPNANPGQVQIRVTATSGGRTGTATITQTNAVATSTASAAAAGFSVLRTVVILAVTAGAVAGGAYAATHNGNPRPLISPVAPTSITPGTPTVGAP